MQIDHIPPRQDVVQVYGTATAPRGVEHLSLRFLSAGRAAAERARAGWKAWVLLALVCMALMGFGQRFEFDYRFDTPSAALLTYWEALAVNDSELLAECFSEPSAALPQPGMVWFLPPMHKLGIHSLVWEKLDEEHMLVSYEVRYWAEGGVQEERLDAATEIVRVEGEWRVVPPDGTADWPDWAPIPRLYKI